MSQQESNKVENDESSATPNENEFKLDISTINTSKQPDLINLWLETKGSIVSQHIRDVGTSKNNPYQIRITQLRALQQESGDQSCGYYSVYYISMLTKIMRKFHQLQTIFIKLQSKNISNNDKDKLDGDYKNLYKDISLLFISLRNPTEYKQFKKNIFDELLTECGKRNSQLKKGESPMYPWIKDHINSGVLERVYLQWLQNDEAITKDGNAGSSAASADVAKKYHFRSVFDVINLLEFSISSLRTNHLPIHRMNLIEKFFESFYLNKEFQKTFLIGSAIHYVCMGLYKNIIDLNSGSNDKNDKNDKKDKDDKDDDGNDRKKIIDIIYIDPQNSDILFVDKYNLYKNVISKMEFKAWLKMGWQRKTMINLAYDSMKGIQFVAYLLTNGIKAHYDKYDEKGIDKIDADGDSYIIREIIIKLNLIDGFLGSCNKHVLIPFMQQQNPTENEKNNKNDDKNKNKNTSVNSNSSNKQGDESKDDKKENNKNDNKSDDSKNENKNKKNKEEKEKENPWFKGVSKDHDHGFDAITSEMASVLGDKDDDENVSCDILQKNFKECIAYCKQLVEQHSKTANDKKNSENGGYDVASALKKWIDTYYPCPVIESNVATVLRKLSQSYIPREIIETMDQWAKLISIVSDEKNRKVFGIDEKSHEFWDRLSSTLVVIDLVCQDKLLETPR